MNCTHARKLYAAFWDDETTQAEREWLESHFTSCETCRRDYEQYARTLEVLGSLPRVEPSPELPERVLQRVRRTETVPDSLPVTRPLWVPIGSAVAAGVLIALILAGPWLGSRRDARTSTAARSTGAITEPVMVQTPASQPAGPASGSNTIALVSGTAATDSLFDHSEDVEFILDPVTLHRGRASVTQAANASRGEKAVITF